MRHAQRDVPSGRRWVVDVDLVKFFDRVHHDLLMGRVAKHVADARVLRLIRRYLEARLAFWGDASRLSRRVLRFSRSAAPGRPHYLNLLNRRMRTRMSGGVGGE